MKKLSSECKYKLSWNLDEKKFEISLSEDKEECLLVSSLPIPLLELTKSLDAHELKSHGYTYVNVYSHEKVKVENQIRISYTCKYDKYNENCSYALIDEEDWLKEKIENIIDKALNMINKYRLKGLIIQSGINEEYFYRFYEKNNTTLVTFLFNKGFLEEIKARVYVATKGLITHNDIQVALENNIGIIYCLEAEGHRFPMMPIDYVLSNEGKLYLSSCILNEPIPNGFLVGHDAKLLFSYYRKRRALSDNDFLNILYSWWKEIGDYKYPPDYLLYDKPVLRNIESFSLIELVNLGCPAKAILSSQL